MAQVNGKLVWGLIVNKLIVDNDKDKYINNSRMMDIYCRKTDHRPYEDSYGTIYARMLMSDHAISITEIENYIMLVGDDIEIYYMNHSSGHPQMGHRIDLQILSGKNIFHSWDFIRKYDGKFFYCVEKNTDDNT